VSMRIWVVMAREGYAREMHGAYMSESSALSRVREMNKAIKKEKYEAVMVNVEG